MGRGYSETVKKRAKVATGGRRRLMVGPARWARSFHSNVSRRAVGGLLLPHVGCTMYICPLFQPAHTHIFLMNPPRF